MRIVESVLAPRRRHPEAHDEAERERLEGRVDDWREDVYVAGGDGAVSPVLPESTAAGLYADFEHDTEKPPDEAP